MTLSEEWPSRTPPSIVPQQPPASKNTTDSDRLPPCGRAGTTSRRSCRGLNPGRRQLRRGSKSSSNGTPGTIRPDKVSGRTQAEHALSKPQTHPSDSEFQSNSGLTSTAASNRSLSLRHRALWNRLHCVVNHNPVRCNISSRQSNPELRGHGPCEASEAKPPGPIAHCRPFN